MFISVRPSHGQEHPVAQSPSDGVYLVVRPWEVHASQGLKVGPHYVTANGVRDGLPSSISYLMIVASCL